MDENANNLWLIKMRVKKGIVMFCIVLLVLPLISSAAVVVNTGDEGIEIKYPPFETIKINEDFEFEFHLFHKANGTLITEGVECFMHIYNSTGKHIYEGNNSIFSHTFDIGFDVPASNFSEAGNYGYNIQCNNTNYGGFSTVGFQVTPSGRAAPTSGEAVAYSTTIISMLLFAVMFFCISLVFKKDDNGDYPSHAAGFKFGFIALSMITALATMLYATITIQQIFWGFEKITNAFGEFHFLVLTLFWLIFIFILIVLIMQVMEKMQIKRGLKIDKPIVKT